MLIPLRKLSSELLVKFQWKYSPEMVHFRYLFQTLFQNSCADTYYLCTEARRNAFNHVPFNFSQYDILLTMDTIHLPIGLIQQLYFAFKWSHLLFSYFTDALTALIIASCYDIVVHAPNFPSAPHSCLRGVRTHYFLLLALKNYLQQNPL